MTALLLFDSDLRKRRKRNRIDIERISSIGIRVVVGSSPEPSTRTESRFSINEESIQRGRSDAQTYLIKHWLPFQRQQGYRLKLL